MTETPTDKLTPEQIAEMQAKMDEHYETMIPRLKKQFEYEDLIAKIEMARLQRVKAIREYAMITTPTEKPVEEPKKN